MRSDRARALGRSSWWTVAATVAVVGWVAALLVTPLSALLASTVVCAALALIVSAAVETSRENRDSPRARATATVDWRRLLDSTLVGTVGAVAVLGLLQVSVVATAFVVVCLGAAAPWALSSPRSDRNEEATPEGSATRGAAVSPPPSAALPAPAAVAAPTGPTSGPDPSASPEAVPAVSSMSTPELALAWRRSYSELAAARSPQQLETVAARRQQLLDELERRDGHGLQRWLHSGARAASDPSRFFQRPA